MGFLKSGLITAADFKESCGTNVLTNSDKYTADSPYVVTGKSTDLCVTTDQYAQVTPGKTYYFLSSTDKEWNNGHGNGNKDKVTIWLYVSEKFDATNYGYKTPVCFTSANWISKGVWKYTIPAGCNMVRVRYNEYSDGSTTVTAKFWDTRLIPEEYYVPLTGASNQIEMHVASSSISTSELTEY